MEPVFFQATRDALDNITELFDFVHLLTASLRFTQRKVDEAKIHAKNFTDVDFKALIDPADNIHGVSTQKIFTEWTHQEEELAWILLNNLFSIHEGWVSRIITEHKATWGVLDFRDTCIYEKYLEQKDLSYQLTSHFLPVPGSSPSIMDAAFSEAYIKSSGLDFAKLDNYMLMYRFFKECRNCYMHANKVASAKVMTAYAEFLPVATLTDLDTAEVPIIPPPENNKPLKISLRGVIGFSQFLRRILIISDITLIKSKASEQDFLNRSSELETLEREKSSGFHTDTLNSSPNRAHYQIRCYPKKLGLLMPTWTQEFQDFLIKNGIFFK